MNIVIEFRIQTEIGLLKQNKITIETSSVIVERGNYTFHLIGNIISKGNP